MKAPFPYFGGKSAIVDEVWQGLGNVKHYIEPFFGSGAVLLARPGWNPKIHLETVNDADGYLANVWRALQADPDAVARVCDWPVNHADLSARKRQLLCDGASLLERLVADPSYYDARLAGYWIWAASCWIGTGLTRLGQTPHISNNGRGVHALGKRPHISHGGMGVHALGQIPHISHGGMGVHAPDKRPHISDGGMGVQEPYNMNIYIWFRELSERLRSVRVVCGDWARVCGGNWQDTRGVVGIFFDPPYGDAATRNPQLYHVESSNVAQEVATWALQRGARPTYRIILAGYYEEHAHLLCHGWRVHRWTAGAAYAAKGSRNTVNRCREALFFSPHCISPDQGTLF